MVSASSRNVRGIKANVRYFFDELLGRPYGWIILDDAALGKESYANRVYTVLPPQHAFNRLMEDYQ